MDTSNRSLLILAHNDHLVGIDRATGAARWRCPLPDTSGHPIELAIDGDRVFAATERGTLFCIDYASGHGHWSAPFEHAAMSGAPPTILLDEGAVHVAFFGRVTCFTRAGQRLWSFRDDAEHTPAAVGFPGNVRAPHRMR
jgi:outer membrane protein assembly factor BamB